MALSKPVIVAGLAAAAYAVFRLTADLKNTVNGLTFGFGYGGPPRIVGAGLIELPIKVTIFNAGFTAVPIQGINLTLQRVLAGGEAYAFAATDPAGVAVPTIAARATTVFIVPFRTQPLEALTEVFTTFTRRGFNQFRALGTVQVAGLAISLPPIPFAF